MAEETSTVLVERPTSDVGVPTVDSLSRDMVRVNRRDQVSGGS